MVKIQHAGAVSQFKMLHPHSHEWLDWQVRIGSGLWAPTEKRTDNTLLRSGLKWTLDALDFCVCLHYTREGFSKWLGRNSSGKQKFACCFKSVKYVRTTDGIHTEAPWQNTKLRETLNYEHEKATAQNVCHHYVILHCRVNAWALLWKPSIFYKPYSFYALFNAFVF